MSNEINSEEKIILRSCFGNKVGMKYFIQPCKDPKTGRYPDCVKPVNANGELILKDSERNSDVEWIPENHVETVEDGTVFDLSDKYRRAVWEAIKNCVWIAEERSINGKGNPKIDGNLKGLHPRWGLAELYIDRPGEESKQRVSRKKLINQAENYIFGDSLADKLTKTKLLGKKMENMPSADVEDYLLKIASENPKKIIDLYTGGDQSLRLLFIDAKDKRVIYLKNGIFMYGDNTSLGATDESVITWMRSPNNKKLLDLIRRDTFPELYITETTEIEDPLKDDKKPIDGKPPKK